MDTIKNIAVIGAGTMGNGIAHVFSQFNHTVHLIDVSQVALDKALVTIGKNLFIASSLGQAINAGRPQQ